VPDFCVQARRTRSRTKPADGDPLSLERGVRQLLADKVSGHLVGVWLLVAEHLRLGTWDLLRGWTGQPTERAEPRLALQFVHEAALCTTGIRSDRTLTHRGGFELAAGLPFVASDSTIHDLLAERSVEDSRKLQVALGRLRRASGDYRGKVLAIDPHRVRSYSHPIGHCPACITIPVPSTWTWNDEPACTPSASSWTDSTSSCPPPTSPKPPRNATSKSACWSALGDWPNN